MAQVSKINMGGIDYDIRDEVLEQEMKQEIATFKEVVTNQVENYKPIVINGDVTNAADEEDITSDNNLLKLKDRPALNGMGYVILRKDKTFAEQVTMANTIYEVRYDFDLGGATVELPDNIGFSFNGGKVYNGVLSGQMLNTTLNAEDFGIVYGETGRYMNGQRLKILTGITSPINLVLNGDMYIHEFTDCVLATPQFTLSSPVKAALNLNLFLGFSAREIAVDGVKILSLGKDYSYGFITPKSEGEASFSIKNCHVEGNIRVWTCNQTASSAAHRVTSISIENNTFERVYCGVSANVLFMATDVMYDRLAVSGNRVHNMYTIFFQGGATNDSAAEELIKTAAVSRPRISDIRNNVVYNDINWKPWEDDAIKAVGSYFCFCLIEFGDCWCEGNIFKNLISNNNSATYDNYLSVFNLVYKNNTWENIFDFQYGAQLMKSKESGGAIGYRHYEGNVYKMEDVGALLGGELTTPSADLIQFDSVMDTVILRDNKVRVYKGYHNAYKIIRAVNLTLENNEIVYDTARFGDSKAWFHAPQEENARWIFQNNTFTTLSVESSSLYFISAPVGAKGSLRLIKNVVNGVVNIISVSEVFDIMMEGNTFTTDGVVTDISENYPFIDYGVIREVDLGTLIYNKKAGELRLIGNSLPKTIRFRYRTSELNQFAFVRGYASYPKGIWNAQVKVTDVIKNQVYKTSVNWKYDENGFAYYGYDGNGKLQTAMSSGVMLYTEGMAASLISISHNGGVRAGGLFTLGNDFEIEVKISAIDDIRKGLIYPKSVATDSRPYLTSAEAGASVYDTTLGKAVWWTGSKWVDATGATV